MDISPKQAQEIAEIEKQMDSNAGPKIISQKETKDKSSLVNILATMGITVGATAAIIVLLALPTKKKVVPQPTIVTSTMQLASPNIVVTTEYVNPFSSAAQYENPFTASQNPFANLTQ